MAWAALFGASGAADRTETKKAKEEMSQSVPVPEGEEHRRARRQRVLMSGYISFEGHFASIPCMIRNLSDTGALILLNHPSPVPQQFTLYLELQGYRVECERVWMKGLQVGAHFIGEKIRTRINREQHVETSENAISDAMRQSMASREHAYEPKPSPPPEQPKQPYKQGAPSFGKRR